MESTPFVAVTNWNWFRYLSTLAVAGRLDEANFWSPRALTPPKNFEAGELVFFRLTAPRSCIAGYGLFAHFSLVTLDEAWRLFGPKNGIPDYPTYLRFFAGERGKDVEDRAFPYEPFACTELRDVHFWPEERWIPWGTTEGWAANTQRGAAVRDPARGARLVATLAGDDELDEVEQELTAPLFRLVPDDGRRRVETAAVVREGQGAFRSRILDAYGRQCAVTGERTEVVLQASHIQRYLGPLSNHVQNGLALTQEFHTLYDRGFVGITPDYQVKVSPALREKWSNGKRYYEFDGRSLVVVPTSPALRPSREALAWHMERTYRSA